MLKSTAHKRRAVDSPTRGATSRTAQAVRHLLITLSFVSAAIVISTITACEDSQAATKTDKTCMALGLCAPPPKAPVGVVVLCDTSMGSTCNRATLEQTLDAVLAHVADRPGSVVWLWSLGKNIAETGVVGEQAVPTRSAKSERSQSAQRERFTKAATGALLSSASRALDEPPIRQSPLAEAITKVGITDDGGLPRQLVVVTDAREMSATAGDFECARLPSDDSTFLTRLEKRGLLTPGILQGIAVHFAFVEGGKIPSRGCPVRIEREVRIRELWTAALTAAGASDVRITTGPPALLDDDGITAPIGGAQ